MLTLLKRTCPVCQVFLTCIWLYVWTAVVLWKKEISYSDVNLCLAVAMAFICSCCNTSWTHWYLEIMISHQVGPSLHHQKMVYVRLTPRPLCTSCVLRYLDSWFKTTAMSTATGTPSSLWESGCKRRKWGLDEKISSLWCWWFLQMVSFCTGSCPVWNRYENANQSHQGQGTNCYIFKMCSKLRFTTNLLQLSSPDFLLHITKQKRFDLHTSLYVQIYYYFLSLPTNLLFHLGLLSRVQFWGRLNLMGSLLRL